MIYRHHEHCELSLEQMKRYPPLKSRSARLCDEYYRLVTECVSGAQPGHVKARCLAVAIEYHEALEDQLKFLLSRPPDRYINHEIEFTREYINLLKNDIKRLTEKDGPLANVRLDGAAPALQYLMQQQL